METPQNPDQVIKEIWSALFEAIDPEELDALIRERLTTLRVKYPAVIQTFGPKDDETTAQLYGVALSILSRAGIDNPGFADWFRHECQFGQDDPA